MKSYFLSSVAEQDIDEIISYISNENPSAALYCTSRAQFMTLCIL